MLICEGEIMADVAAKDAMEDERTLEPPKDRQCLRCEETFSSTWSGERICLRCKGSSSWRRGAPL
jgi:hypothetical protein